MKLRDLISTLRHFADAGHADKQVKIWLPGSRVSLSNAFFFKSENAIMLEGNVDPGSALDDVLGDKTSDTPDLLGLLRELVRSDVLGATTYMLLTPSTLRDILETARSMLNIEEKAQQTLNAELRSEYLQHVATIEEYLSNIGE